MTDLMNSPLIRACRVVMLLAAMLPCAAQAGSWDTTKGKGYVICEAIKKRLNKYHWTEEQTLGYAAAVVDSYPGWKEPPWEDIDPQQHQELIRKLIRYEDKGAAVYFGRQKERWPSKRQDEINEERFRWSMEHGVRLQVWRTHLINWLDNRQVLEGEQTVVQLRYPPIPEIRKKQQAERPDIPLVNRGSSTFIVKEDFSDLDPRVEDGIGRALARSTVLLFDGVPYFVGGGLGYSYSVRIDRDFGSGPRSNPFCIIEFNEPKGKE